MQIDKGIPIPSRRADAFGFSDMEIGDSVFIPASTPDERHAARHRPGAYKQTHPGWGYVTKTRVEGGIMGVRVWRIV